MNLHFSFYAANFSTVFGGQERYLESLFTELQRRGVNCEFTGGPECLTQLVARTKQVGKLGPRVELLNGNRALYLRAWRRRTTDLRVYVQHSNILDGQQSPLKRWIRKLLLRLLLTRVDAVIRVCQQSLPDRYAPGKIHTIYNGVSLPALPAVTEVKRPFTLLMVGAINDNKNQLLALRLLEKQPDIRLILVGDGPRKAQWQQWASDKGLASRIDWTGFVDQPEVYYPQADALLMLSRFEAFPYVVLEAMSYGLPVIAVPVGGVPEAITHERDGLVLTSCELQELNQAVQRFTDNPEWRRQLGCNARQTVSECFTLEQMVDSLLGVIEKTARKKGLIT